MTLGQKATCSVHHMDSDDLLEVKLSYRPNASAVQC